MATDNHSGFIRDRVRRPLPLVVGAAIVLALASAPTAPAFVAKGRVSYGYRLCTRAQHVHREDLQGGLVQFFNHGNVVASTQTDSGGRFSAEVGPKPVTARVVLDSPGRFFVTPNGSKPYSFLLGDFSRKDPSVPRGVGFTHEGAGGSMNIFNAMQVGANVAGPLAEEAGRVPVIWDPDRRLRASIDLTNSRTFYDIAHRRIVIDGAGKRNGDEWEPWVVLHEYGHHLLFSLHAVGGTPTNPGNRPHYPSQGYPAAPALAWSEGFADAFATLAQDSAGDLYGTPVGWADRGCHQFMDLGAGRPVPTPPVLDVQYNETAAASVIWGLSSLLGGGDDLTLRAAGLRMLVRIARGHYRPPEDMHDVRDALTSVPGVEETPADHDKIDRIFGERGHMAWGRSAAVALASDSGGVFQLHLQLTGPAGYQNCEVTDDFGTYMQQGTGEGPFPGTMVPGGLDYTWQDDCLIFSADSTLNATPDGPAGGPINGAFLLSFPFFSGGGHRSGPYKLSATWLCQDVPPNEGYPGSQCPAGAKYAVVECNVVSSGPIDVCPSNSVGSSLQMVTLENGTPRLLLEFTADGRECWLHGDDPLRDCTIGKSW